MAEENFVSTWRIILAFILDFITAFVVFGFLVAFLTGGLTENGFQLSGFPAVLLFAAIIAYFLLAKRVFGGRLWERILKAVR